MPRKVVAKPEKKKRSTTTATTIKKKKIKRTSRQAEPVEEDVGTASSVEVDAEVAGDNAADDLEVLEQDQELDLDQSEFKEELVDEAGQEDEEEQEAVVPKISRRERLNQRASERKQTEGRTVFIGNAPAETKRKDVRKMFRQFGQVQAVYQRSLLQMTEKLTKLMLGKYKELQGRLTTTNFFVRFAKVEEAREAAEKMNRTMLGGNALRVTLSTKPKLTPSHSIFLGNLPFSTSEDRVRAFFSQFGQVANVRLLHNRQTALNTGAGYVEFEERESVQKALEMDGKQFEGRQLRVTKVFKKKKRTADDPEVKKSVDGYRKRQKRSGKLSKKVRKEIKKRRAKKGGQEGGGKRRSLIT